LSDTDPIAIFVEVLAVISTANYTYFTKCIAIETNTHDAVSSL